MPRVIAGPARFPTPDVGERAHPMITLSEPGAIGSLRRREQSVAGRGEPGWARLRPDGDQACRGEPRAGELVAEAEAVDDQEST
jgi:hypothetical protein